MIVAALFFPVTVLYHKPLLLGQRFFSDDLARYNGPLLHYFADRVRAGEIPRWNPELFGGTPFLVNPQVAAFYPPVWISLLLRVDVAITCLIVGHVLLAGLLMYAYGRWGLGVSPVAALLAGFTFSFSGPLAAHYIHPEHLMSAAWLPGIALCYVRGRDSARWIWFGAGGLLLGLSILAGGPQSTYLNCLTLVWLCAWGSVRALAARSSAWSGSRWRPIGGLMVMAVVSAGVAAAQLVPTFQFIPFSSRAGGLNYAFATTFSLPPAYAGLLLVCPHFFGHQGVGYWGAWNQHELTIYAGILPLILVTVGVWAAVHRPDGLALVALAASSLLLAMGDYTPLYRYAYEYLPGVAYFRAPARFLLPFHFAVASLAAVGADAVLAVRRVRWRLLGVLLGWGVVAGAGVWFLSRADFLPRLVALGLPNPDRDSMAIMHDLTKLVRSGAPVQDYFVPQFLWASVLVWLSTGVVLWARRQALQGGLAALVLLGVDLAVFHSGLPSWARAGEGADYLRRRDWVDFMKQDSRQYRGEVRFWPTNIATLHDLRIADGYAAFWPQRRHTQLEQACQAARLANRYDQLFARAYTADSAAAAAPPADPGVEPEGPSVFRSRDDPRVTVHRRVVPPRFQVILHGRNAADESEALGLVLEPDFDPAHSVILEPAEDRSIDLPTLQDQTGEAADRSGAAPDRSGQLAAIGSTRVLEDKPERIVVSVDSPAAGWLVLADAYWPGWQARVDGVPRPVLRANFYFRAVPVPKGHSLVELRYEDHTVWIGAALTVATLGGSLWRLVRSLRNTRQAGSGVVG